MAQFISSGRFNGSEGVINFKFSSRISCYMYTRASSISNAYKHVFSLFLITMRFWFSESQNFANLMKYIGKSMYICNNIKIYFMMILIIMILYRTCYSFFFLYTSKVALLHCYIVVVLKLDCKFSFVCYIWVLLIFIIHEIYYYYICLR